MLTVPVWQIVKLGLPDKFKIKDIVVRWQKAKPYLFIFLYLFPSSTFYYRRYLNIDFLVLLPILIPVNQNSLALEIGLTGFCSLRQSDCFRILVWAWHGGWIRMDINEKRIRASSNSHPHHRGSEVAFQIIRYMLFKSSTRTRRDPKVHWIVFLSWTRHG